MRGYCGPDSYKPRAPQLYRNRGSGPVRGRDGARRARRSRPTRRWAWPFSTTTATAGPTSSSAAIACRRKLYRNDGKGRFVDEARAGRRGAQRERRARAPTWAWMPPTTIARAARICSSATSSTRCSACIATSTARTFVDVAPRSEVGRASLLSVTWAVFFLDYDLDGFLDIFAANGGTDESQATDARARVSQPPLMLRNRGDGTFENVTPSLGAALQPTDHGPWRRLCSISTATAISTSSSRRSPARPFSFATTAAASINWLRVRAVGARSNRSGLGAVVRVTSASGTQTQMVRSGSSYASQSELTLTFGLGRDRTVVDDGEFSGRRARPRHSATLPRTSSSSSTRPRGSDELESGMVIENRRQSNDPIGRRSPDSRFSPLLTDELLFDEPLEELERRRNGGGSGASRPFTRKLGLPLTP